MSRFTFRQGTHLAHAVVIVTLGFALGSLAGRGQIGPVWMFAVLSSVLGLGSYVAGLMARPSNR